MDRNMESNMQKLDAISNNATKNNNMEAETMANENNRNMDNTRALDATTYGSLAENEQAVTESFPECTDLMVQENSLPQEAGTTPTGIKAWTGFIGDMDEYDRAVETEKPYVRKSTMLNKDVRLITDSRGRVLCAWISNDEKGKRMIVVVQQYTDGTYSSELEMKKSDIVMSSMTSGGMDDMIQKKVKKFLYETWEKYTNDFAGTPDEVIKVSDIVGLLGSELNNIPVYEDGFTELERMEFHKKILGMAGSLTSQAFNDHKAYYPLTEEDLTDIARNCGLDKLGLLRRLKKYNLLYLTPSSKGLQANVRMKGTGSQSYTVRRYCVLRNAELENNEEYTDYNF